MSFEESWTFPEGEELECTEVKKAMADCLGAVGTTWRPVSDEWEELDTDEPLDQGQELDEALEEEGNDEQGLALEVEIPCDQARQIAEKLDPEHRHWLVSDFELDPPSDDASFYTIIVDFLPREDDWSSYRMTLCSNDGDNREAWPLACVIAHTVAARLGGTVLDPDYGP